jgi:hypothetical protein
MTAIARGHRPAESSSGIDVRCSARLPRGNSDDVRCQLFAGHDGPHAVMFAQCGERMVRTWTGADPVPAAEDCRTMSHRPWMLGFPLPAWSETGPETAD